MADTYRTPKFIYFDLGNVLLYFDHQRLCRQMGEVVQVETAKVFELLFDRGLNWRYEEGAVSRQQFFDAFCAEWGVSPEVEALERAGSDIFHLNDSMLPVIAALENAGYPLGILSNTNESHWRFVTAGQYSILPGSFKVHALSYELGGMKPDKQVYLKAAEMAGVAPEEIFYCDDMPANVEGAIAAGYDAVLFTSARQYVHDLRQRGIRFNY